MTTVADKYEVVIGLEVHIQLLTASKVFSNDTNSFGADPNTCTSVISLGHPGTLPRLNKKVLEHAVKLGIACQAKITTRNEFSRKNYFYADLPKGYQITQFTTPICTGGFIEIKTGPRKSGTSRINLTRIHIEEDAGKSIHDLDPFNTLIDLNRAGVPLLEMVTEPEIRSGEEAHRFLTEVRKLVRYLGICDGNLEEGSMRCDANISIRLRGEKKLGQKVEIKNMNSMRNVQRAVEHEILRQVGMAEAGENILQDTRSFDAESGTTFSMRSKELAHDYRYFPEPDLLPVIISKEFIDQIKNNLEPLPQQLAKKYVNDYGLPVYDADIITDDKNTAFYFEKITGYLRKLNPVSPNYKSAANWLMVNIRSYLNEQAIDITQFEVDPENICRLIMLIDNGKVSHTVASQKIFPLMIKYPGKSPEEIATEQNLLLENNLESLEEIIKAVLTAYPDKVNEYKSGKKGLLGFFMGEVMKRAGTKADPKVASRMIAGMLAK